MIGNNHLELAGPNAPKLSEAGLLCDHYTYFIVPFGYRLIPAYKGEGPVYCEDGQKASRLYGLIDTDASPPDADDPFSARKRYLLPETHLTLFERARWFRLQEDELQGEKPGHIFCGALTYNDICLTFKAVAELILFEWESALKEKEEPLEAVGLLLLATVLQKPGSADSTNVEPSLGALLDLNERLRYLDRPFPTNRSSLCIPWCKVDSDAKDEDYWSNRWAPLIRRPIKSSRGKFSHVEVTPVFPQRNHSERGANDSSWRNTGVTDRQDRDFPHPGGYPDDRAFVYTFAYVAGNTDPIHVDHIQDSHAYNWRKLWHAMLDVDGQWRITDRVTPYEQAWVGERTYTRWAHSGTLYGYTDFSAALLIMQGEYGNPWLPPAQHFRHMYLDQLLLLLYERTTLYRFSAAISNVSANLDDRASREYFRLLRRKFTYLTNLYQFPVFTTQYQGRDLYMLARGNLGIDQFYKEVETEIRATDELLSQEAAELVNRRLSQIQYVGLAAALLGIALATAGALFTLLQLKAAQLSSVTSHFPLPSSWHVGSHLRSWLIPILGYTAGIAAVCGVVTLVLIVGYLAWLLMRKVVKSF